VFGSPRRINGRLILHYISALDAERVDISHSDVVGLVRAALIEKAKGRVECPPKPGIHPKPNAFMHAMPAYVESFAAAGVKWVSGFPANTAAGLPYISGIIILNSPETGLPETIIDARRVTALRTAAVTGLALETLKDAKLETVAIIGCGQQGRTHLGLLDELFTEVAEIRLFDISDEAARRARRSSTLMERCRISPNIHAAADGADAIITAVAERDEGKAGQIEAGWMDPNGLALPLANDYGWSADALSECDDLFVDDVPQFVHFQEIGELSRTKGLPEPREFSSLLINGTRETRPGKTCCMNLGLAIHDIVVGKEISQRAHEAGHGVALDV
jgi:ornithine cyclodeaminase/alanine dehydrogenase-like protein (mu-crystallin family)